MGPPPSPCTQQQHPNRSQPPQFPPLPSHLENVMPSPPAAGLKQQRIAALVINVVGFEALLASNDEDLAVSLSSYIKTVHTTVGRHDGNIDTILGDQLFVTFNAHTACPDPAPVAATVACLLQDTLSNNFRQFRIGMGLAVGRAAVGSLGYQRFRSIVCMGGAMKLAGLLAHVRSRYAQGVGLPASVAPQSPPASGGLWPTAGRLTGVGSCQGRGGGEEGRGGGGDWRTDVHRYGLGRTADNRRRRGFTPIFPPPPPCVTFRWVAVSLRGPGQSRVRPSACCVGSLRSDGCCGRCSFCGVVFALAGPSRWSPPPPLDPDFIVGNNEIYRRKY